MSDITERISVSAGVEEAARLVADPARLAEWHPAIARSDVEGSIRHLALADGPAFDERITARSERGYAYVIPDNPLPLDDYSSELTVEPDGDGSTITWTGHFRARGISDAEADQMVSGLYRAGLESARTQLG